MASGRRNPISGKLHSGAGASLGSPGSFVPSRKVVRPYAPAPGRRGELTRRQQRVLAALGPEPVAPAEITAQLKLERGAAGNDLRKLSQRGLAIRTGGGWVRVPQP
jgi:predicted Rossmann fold nucleotide-binding protein DprA/Smf involved in DNA uptake